MPEPLVIIGAGGHGREMLDVARSMLAPDGHPCWDFKGFLDDGNPDLEILGRLDRAPFLGAVSLLADLNARYVIGIGTGSIRRRVDQQCQQWQREAATLVHSSATIGADVELGHGTVLAAGARVTTNVRMGRNVHINANATVHHDVVIGDYVTLSPGVHVSGAVILDDEVLVGANAAINQGVRIGPRTTIGSGAAVVCDLQADVTAVGVPARPIGDR